MKKMIKSIKLKNFFSFQNAEIKFDTQTNVLIGINGSGKSNLLKAIKLLKEGISGNLKNLIYDTWGGFDAVCYKGNEKNSVISLEFKFDGKIINEYGARFNEDLSYLINIHNVSGTNNYYIEEKMFRASKKEKQIFFVYFLKGSGVLFENKKKASRPNKVSYRKKDPQELVLSQIKDPDRYLIQDAVCKAIEDIEIYDYFDTTARSVVRKPMLPTSEKRLLPDGSNLSQMLNTININYKDQYNHILKSLNEVNDKFLKFDFHFIGGNIELMLEEKLLNGSIPVTHISDGTLKYLCLLSIFFNPERGKFVCIDEPETDLHPDMIYNLTKAIKDTSTETKYLIATHSENVLNGFEIKDVRVLEKDNENRTVINTYKENDFKGWYDNFMVGNMWRQGDIGGNRW
jgi:predicted ATPase